MQLHFSKRYYITRSRGINYRQYVSRRLEGTSETARSISKWTKLFFFSLRGENNFNLDKRGRFPSFSLDAHLHIFSLSLSFSLYVLHREEK